MQDDLPKSETARHHRDADEWRYSRTADPHDNVYVRLELLRLQRAVHDQLVSQTHYYFSTLPPSAPLFLTQWLLQERVRRRAPPLWRAFVSLRERELDESFFFQLVVLTPVINPFRLSTGLSGYTLPRSYLG